MFLDKLSIKEFDLNISFKNAREKISQQTKFDRFMTYFWLLGPFFFLIERDPADLWLTIIAVVFFIKCIIEKNWDWAFQGWFKISFIFWLFCFLSSILSKDPIYSLSQSFVWFRFPLFVAATQIWLGKNRDIRILMFVSIFIGLLTMCSILTAELIIEPKTRLSWPYGDLVPGGYIAKVCLPIFLVLVAIAVSKKNFLGIICALVCIITIIFSFLTGERTNFLIITCGGMFAGLVWKSRVSLYVFLICIIFSFLAVSTMIRPDLSEKYIDRFYKPIVEMRFQETNGFWGAWRMGIQQGIETPIIGVGPSGTRHNCKKLPKNEPEWLPGKNYCGNHPHNFYIQLFAETGVIGLFLGSATMLSLIITCFKARRFLPSCPMTSTAFIVPLGLFFPIQQFGSFFGQWGNLFIWFAIAFAISNCQNWKEK